MTKAPYDPNHPKIRSVEVRWHAVTYKTVMVYSSVLLVIGLAISYLISPGFYSRLIDKTIEKISGGDADAAPVALTQAKFVNLDGTVQIKKVNSVQWVDADYRTTLDKGDQIKTSADGAARIAFADGTTYTVKAGSFITVEENSMTQTRETTSGIRINLGQVDLTTGGGAASSLQAKVSIEDTTTQVRPNSSVTAKNDPTRNEHEVVLKSGGAEIVRGQERVELLPYEKVSFASGGPMQKSNVLAPPELAMPLTLQSLIVTDPKEATVHFEWKPVPEATSYTLRVSTTAMFSSPAVEKRVAGTSVEVTGLEAGEYFWNVTAMDSKKRVSEPSDPFKFTLVAQSKTQDMLLEVEGTQLHGRMVEIIGRTEPGASLIINGQPVSNIGADGKFQHFTEQLQPGQQTIVITGQNRRGGTAIQRVPIVIPK